MRRTVREPIQVYLTSDERAELDRAAAEMGVSRSEVLRRGIQAVRKRGYRGALGDLADEGLVTPPTSGPGAPPPSGPVLGIDELLSSLEEDRADR